MVNGSLKPVLEPVLIKKVIGFSALADSGYIRCRIAESTFQSIDFNAFFPSGWESSDREENARKGGRCCYLFEPLLFELLCGKDRARIRHFSR